MDKDVVYAYERFAYRSAFADALSLAVPISRGVAFTLANMLWEGGILPIKTLDPHLCACVLAKMYWMWLIGEYERESPSLISPNFNAIEYFTNVIRFHVNDFGNVEEFHNYVVAGGPKGTDDE